MRAEFAPTGDAAPFVLMTRGVVEDAALGVIESVQRSVGTRAFFTGDNVACFIAGGNSHRDLSGGLVYTHTCFP